MSGPRAEHTTYEGHHAIVLAAGGYELTLVPDLGLFGASLRHEGEEYLYSAGTEAYATGEWSGLPLLYPWANRLTRECFEVLGRQVDVRGVPGVARDERGLPIHGSFTAIPGWQVEVLLADATRALCNARFDLGADPAQLAGFPFPHEVSVFVVVGPDGVRITTTVHANRGVDVPVSFGWHPYFRLPGAARSDLRLVLPPRDHLELDQRLIPTGAATHEPAATIELEPRGGLVVFDDAWEVAEHARVVLEDRRGMRRLAVVFEGGYHVLVVYAPVGRDVVCLEPMVTRTNALVDGGFPVVPAGGTYRATFAVVVEATAVAEDS